jgi:hypothetical protein
MSHTTQPPTNLAVPEDLDSPTGKLCYTYLSVTGPSTVGELSSALDLRRLELFPVLETFRERDWVNRNGDRFVLSETDA